MLPEVLPTVDPELGALVRAELPSPRRGGDHHAPLVTRSAAPQWERPGRLQVDGTGGDGEPYRRLVDLVLVSVGVRPDTELLVAAGATTAPAAPSPWTSRCAPGYPTSSPPATA